jgi:hypothetical protein
MSTQFRMPTPDEMTALRAAAHRARARLMKVILQKAVRALKWRLAHAAAATTPKRVSHA